MSNFWLIVRFVILLTILVAAAINLFLAYTFTHLAGNCSFDTIEQFAACERNWDLAFVKWAMLTLAVSTAAVWLTFKKWRKE